MIGFLQGDAVWRDNDNVCVVAGGVGYIVKAVDPGVSSDDKKVSYFIYHVVREDSESLYGFSTLVQRQLFETFLSVSGVGPSLAFAALRAFPPSKLATIVATKDLNSFCQIPGVGKKTGERLLVALHLKINSKDFEVDGEETQEDDVSRDAFDVLSQFGYTHKEIRRALSTIDTTTLEAGEVIKKALTILKSED